MIILFYVSGFIAIVTTIGVILNTNPIHALLYLIVSLLSVSFSLFILKAPFAGAIETIIYAGAIMVLFVFVIMMLNTEYDDSYIDNKESHFLSIKVCFGVLLLMSNILIFLLYIIFKKDDCFINIYQSMISLKKVGITLFGSYMLTVELASFLLLGALISVLHIAHESNIFTNFDPTQLPEYKK